MSTNPRLDRFSALLTTHLTQPVPAWPVVIARVYLGWFFIQTGLNKVGKGQGGLGYQDTLVQFVTGNLGEAAGWYRPFLEHVVLDHAELFTLLVAWGELLMGMALVTGLFVRWATLGGMLMTANFAFAQGRGLSLPSMDAAIFWTMMTLHFVRAGKVLGLDGCIVSWRNARQRVAAG